MDRSNSTARRAPTQDLEDDNPGGGNLYDELQADDPFGNAGQEPSLGAAEDINQQVASAFISAPIDGVG